MIRRIRTGAAMAVLTWLSTAAPSAAIDAFAFPSAAGPDSTTWEVWYSVRARVRNGRVDADLEAGGRLSMVKEGVASKSLRLSLREVLEHPWKLYWVDPIGPLGKEVKTASVVTLPKASWASLDAARKANSRVGSARHRQWFEQAERPRKLDGSFAFIVVGAARDRFQFTVEPDGSVTGVINRMTDHWLPGPFDQFIGTWDDAGRTSSAPKGYWFWNHGEQRPFDYEPHTYHAFAAALELLAWPLPPKQAPPKGTVDTVRWDAGANTALGVLETLAPQIDRHRTRGHAPAAAALAVARTALPDGSSEILLTTPATPATPATTMIERRARFSSLGSLISDWVRVEVSSKGLGNLEVGIGYRQQGPAKESR